MHRFFDVRIKVGQALEEARSGAGTYKKCQELYATDRSRRTGHFRESAAYRVRVPQSRNARLFTDSGQAYASETHSFPTRRDVAVFT